MNYIISVYLLAFLSSIFFINIDLNAQDISTSFIANDEVSLNASIQVSNLTFGNCLPGDTLKKNLLIKNNGTSDLVIYGYTQTFTRGIYTFRDWNGQDSIVISPNKDTTISLLFTPDFTMLFYDTIIFHSNATSGDSISYLLGRGIIYISVDEDSTPNDIIVSPNPLDKMQLLKIHMPNNITGYCNINIFDRLGSLVYHKSEHITNSELLHINFDNLLPSGQYFCRVTNQFTLLETVFVVM
jgi:hypothetical protein